MRYIIPLLTLLAACADSTHDGRQIQDTVASGPPVERTDLDRMSSTRATPIDRSLLGGQDGEPVDAEPSAPVPPDPPEVDDGFENDTDTDTDWDTEDTDSHEG